MSSLKLDLAIIDNDTINIETIENSVVSEYEQLNEKFDSIISRIKTRKNKKKKMDE